MSRIFEKPTRVDITWDEVESLFIACNALIKEGRGSRKRIIIDNQILGIHVPHPQKEFKQYAVKEIRIFLENLGITPQ